VRLKSTSLLLAAGLIANGVPALANTVAPTAPAHLIPGVYDPKTNTFKPYVSPGTASFNPNASTVTRAGTFVVDFTIAIASKNISTSTPIYVQVEAYTSETNPTTFQSSTFDEFGSVEAVRTSATAAHCSVTIPYSWAGLATPTKDAVNLNYTITAGTASIATLYGIRQSSQTIVTLPAVPLNDSTTTEKVSATI
jgi:hypothetical protein